MTDRYAVIGHPIAHSKSPLIHAAFARQTGQDLCYEAVLAPLDGFRASVQDFIAAGGKGMNVTVPFKIEALELADELTPRARQAGAVNTLLFGPAGITGDNTDGAGLVRDIQERLQFALAGKRVLILGAGGAARGVILPLLETGPACLAVANRSLASAQALRDQFAPFADLRIGGFADFAGADFDLVINATSAGLAGGALPLPAGMIARGALAYDMVYGPAARLFRQTALDLGAGQVVDGLGMLVYQAAESFRLWRGVSPDPLPVLALLRAG